MSGDVQPRKRKDKKRKKDEVGSSVSEDIPTPFSADETFHVHKDGGTGGNFLAKIVFFVLMAALVVMVGLVITEYRGSTDVDTPVSESRWATFLDGWVDDSIGKHDDHDEPAASEEEEDHGGDDHGEQEHSAEEKQDEDEHDEHEEEEEEAEPEEEAELSTEEIEPSQEEEEDDEPEEVEKQESEEQVEPEEEEDEGVEEVEEEEQQSDEANEEQSEEENGEEEEEREEPASEEANASQEEEEEVETVDEGSEELELEIPGITESKEIVDDDEDEGIGSEEESDEGEAKHKRAQGSQSSTLQGDPQTGGRPVARVIPSPTFDSDKQKTEKLEIQENDREPLHPTRIPKSPQKSHSKESTILTNNPQSQSDKQAANEAKGESTNPIQEEILLDSIEPSFVTPQKRNLQATTMKPEMRVVTSATLVDSQTKGNNTPKEGNLIKPTNTKQPEIGTKKPEPSSIKKSEEIKSETPPSKISNVNITTSKLQSQSNISSKEETKLKSSENETKELKLPKEDSNKNINKDPKKEIPKSVPADKISTTIPTTQKPASTPKPPVPPPPPPMNNDFSSKKMIDGVEEIEEVEEVEDPQDADNEIAQNQLVDDEEEEEEDIVPENEGLMSSGKQSEEEVQAKPPTPPPTKASPQVKPKPATGGRSAEEDDEKAQYGDEWDIKGILDDADAQIDQNPKAALIAYSVLLEKYTKSPRGWLGKAKVLDRLAEIRHSNTLLTQAIETYQNFLMLPNVPDNLWIEAALRCIDRMRFRGQHNKALAIHEELVKKFPDDFNYPNQMAVTLLILNRVAEAKVVLENVLKKWPNNGFAQVHYGFILKTSENKLEEAVKYLDQGIKSGETGTIDGRFFFQLGDSLTRLGRSEEAYNIYKLGVKKNLFLSVYQRSLYNVNRLTGKPWWEIQDTPYLIHFEILKRNWQTIRDEALAALQPDRPSAFKDETENLKDTGDWKQLEFYARGHRRDANCKLAPVTCALLDQFPAARKCSRGQSKFSVMTGGTHVWPHCGPTNCRLRAHLGLKVPSGTSIRVANETRTWREGEIIIFDDSFEHEVWHNGTESRVVLIVDVWHPELTENELLTLPAI